MKKIAITSGEPAGIGPDICLALAQHDFDCALAIHADQSVLAARAVAMGLDVKFTEYNGQAHQRGTLSIVQHDVAEPVQAGTLAVGNAAYVVDMISSATANCLQGTADAVVTAPVHKGIINDAGVPFSGHTEAIAAQCDVSNPVMMLADESLRVTLATTHLPLSAVPAAITEERLVALLKIIDHDLRTKFGFSAPRIAVCGLNPHAGEDGHLGHEDQREIAPAIAQCQALGIDAFGPLPADTAFTTKQLQHCDAVLAMYHDQGLPVVKHCGFGRVVNVTLGLPIIRTSVDHGTALDLAATGTADSQSLLSAIRLALTMAQTRS